jgi:methanogenic corrinoid protein MtbC1
LLFDKDGYLWISSGDRQKFTPAQDMQANLGKVLRMRDDRSIPDDNRFVHYFDENPLVDDEGVYAQIWSLGHRNVLGLAFDREGQLWEIEIGPHGAHLLASSLEAAGRLDTAALERTLAEASVSLSRPALMEQLIVPLMHRLGDAWREGTLRPAREHLASAVVRSFFGSLNGAFPVSPMAPRIIVTTPPGQLHEIGALLAAVTAASEGWRVTYLGPSLPADEIAAAVRQADARAVAMSVVTATEDSHIRAEIQRLAQLLEPGTAILLGGRGASGVRSALEAAGAHYLPDYASLRAKLEAIQLGQPAD